MAKILVVEDDAGIALVVQDTLDFEHHTVEVVSDGTLALEYISQYQYDLIVMDVELPGLSGLEITQRFRAKGGETPILMLTGKSDIEDKMAGFNVGVDDYLTKPFHPTELVARVHAVLKRSSKGVAEKVKIRHLTLDFRAMQAWCGAKEIKLSPLEFSILEFLLAHTGEVFSQDALLARVWPSTSERTAETVRTSISKLRQKIDLPGEPSIIGTVHGLGYRLVNEVSSGGN